MRCRYLAVIVLLLTLPGCSSGGAIWEPLANPVPTIDFTLPLLDGGKASLRDFRGKIVVMEFWATWCPSCRNSTRSLDVVYRRYRDKGVTMLLVNEGEDPDTIKAWIGGKFAAPILLDRYGQVAGLYGLDGIPHMFVIDKEGNIVHAHGGYAGALERNLSAFLDLLLAGDKPPVDA